MPDKDTGDITPLSSFTAGVKDALSFHNVLVFLLTSASVRKNMIRCALLNLLLFSGSIFLTNSVVLPISRKILGDVSCASIVFAILQRMYQIVCIAFIPYIGF
jgi:hypothetical protein